MLCDVTVKDADRRASMLYIYGASDRIAFMYYAVCERHGNIVYNAHGNSRALCVSVTRSMLPHSEVIVLMESKKGGGEHHNSRWNVKRENMCSNNHNTFAEPSACVARIVIPD